MSSSERLCPRFHVGAGAQEALACREDQDHRCDVHGCCRSAKQGDSLVGTVDMKKRIDNLQAVLAFAMAMQEKLEEINQQSFNSFKLRIGRLS